MRAVCADFATGLVEFVSQRDHVHLLVHYPPKISISQLAGSLKSVSARRHRQDYPDHIHKHLPGAHYWSPSYLAASCGAPLSMIKEYIDTQKRPRQTAEAKHRRHGPEQSREAPPPGREHPEFRARSC